MYGQIFSKMFGHTDPLLVFPVVSLLIFIVTFTSVIVRVMRRPKSEMIALASMPLEKETSQ
jgi:hypothetical protein